MVKTISIDRQADRLYEMVCVNMPFLEPCTELTKLVALGCPPLLTINGGGGLRRSWEWGSPSSIDGGNYRFGDTLIWLQIKRPEPYNHSTTSPLVTNYVTIR